MVSPANNPNYAPVINDFFVVSVSVSTIGSAQAAGVGPFRGIYFRTSASVTVVSPNGNSLVLDNIAKNVTLWIQGAYISAIATATSQYGVV